MKDDVMLSVKAQKECSLERYLNFKASVITNTTNKLNYSHQLTVLLYLHMQR